MSWVAWVESKLEKKRKKRWRVEFELEKKRKKRQSVRKGRGTWYVWVGIKKLIFVFNSSL